MLSLSILLFVVCRCRRLSYRVLSHVGSSLVGAAAPGHWQDTGGTIGLGHWWAVVVFCAVIVCGSCTTSMCHWFVSVVGVAIAVCVCVIECCRVVGGSV